MLIIPFSFSGYNIIPTWAAKYTNAISSGLAPVYLSYYYDYSAMIWLQTPKQIKLSRI